MPALHRPAPALPTRADPCAVVPFSRPKAPLGRPPSPFVHRLLGAGPHGLRLLEPGASDVAV
ncbi:MAG: hypothetical protein ABW042_07725, partial [Phenylobacterium sp.]